MATLQVRSSLGVVGQSRPARWLRTAWQSVTPAGRAIIALGLLTWLLGWRFGWAEMMAVAAACLMLLVAAVLFTFGRGAVTAAVRIDPQRVTVGDRSSGQLDVTNAERRRLLPMRINLSVGETITEFAIPSLGPGETDESLFVLPTARRAIIPVGPAASVRGDPLGLLERSVALTEPIPLYVHPKRAPLGSLGSGLLRDLEGQATKDLSNSDVAFHTIREYEPGDDRRHVHWLTTARVGALMVRQFLDTRRSHMAVLVDGDRTSYASDQEFELALSIAASLGTRVLVDEQQVSMVAAGERIPTATGTAMLDGLAGVGLRSVGFGLPWAVEHLLHYVAGISVAILITGSGRNVSEIRLAGSRLPLDVRSIAIRADVEGATSFRPVGAMPLLNVADLAELGHALSAVMEP